MKYSLLLLSVLWQLSSKAQSSKTTLSGTVRDATQSALPFVNVTLLAVKDSSLVAGTITNEKGMFSIGILRPASTSCDAPTPDSKLQNRLFS
ncbi:carboxypeptidase-like regulatory domain-containing protein [Pseudobacter ginsenosidimutans]|uniref:carboxypeptidase-like regulatory domain-containing protein n=1 Tax=Pseudobacter ginsenosidimutans TaxID=661488 RepID=UPI001CEF5C55|nr:carboxypeptidase-like regulatory domain-containing protein [Pseudobacter ginsenosidimutans]